MKRIILGLIVTGAMTQAIAAPQATSCFVRNYDREHLSEHPNQLVTNVRLLIKEAKPRVDFDFLFEIKRRGSSKELLTEGSCQNGSMLHCTVECDGGGINVSVRPGYAMMYLARIRMAACEGDKNDINKGEEVFGGIDDRVFKLPLVDDAMCSDMKFF